MTLQWVYMAVAILGFTSMCTCSPVDPMITPAPSLVKRDTEDLYINLPFIGYYSSPGGNSWIASSCAGTSYVEDPIIGADTSATYYGGCDSSSVLSIFTVCDGPNAYGEVYTSDYSTYTYTDSSAIYLSEVITYVYSGMTASACTGGSYCIVDKLMDSPNAQSSSYFIQCATRSPLTLYRTGLQYLPLIQPATTTSSSASSSILSTVSSTASTTTSTSVGPTSPTSQPSPSPSPTPKHRSIAGPIAGGVIGGIAVLAFAIFLIWFTLKKRQNQFFAAHAPGDSQPVMVSQQPITPSVMPEKTVTAATTPVSPYSQQGVWSPNMAAPHGISPPGSPPPPNYFNQPQSLYSQQGNHRESLP